MNGNTRSKKVYNGLIRKLFFQTLFMLLAAAGAVIILRNVLHGKMGDIITHVICRIRGVEWEDGMIFYQIYIRNNLDMIIIISVLVLFFVLFRIYLMWFTKYFDQITAAVDNLSEEAAEPIKMCPELEFMETKLNETKRKLKEREEAVSLAEERKNELVVYLAHDIKTPLTSVIGYLSLLEEEPLMPVEVRARHVHIALEKAYRLETLMNQFFEITRYNLNDIPIEQTNINLCYMLVQISDELYPQMNGKRIIIEVKDELEIFADPDKMARVFNNILKNAVSYSEADSAICINAEEAEREVKIRFRSRGVIPRHKLETIFEKFYRVDRARTSRSGGAGLGLAIAKDIVHLHKGKIYAAIDSEDTVFTVELPKH